MGTRDFEILSLMVNSSNTITGNIQALFAVGQNSTVSEASHPELTQHLHILMGNRVALIVRGLLFRALVLSCTIEI
jgi:hypothetical protein